MAEKSKTFDFETDGTIRTIYDDDLGNFAKDLSGEMSVVCRLSNVEWEEIQEPINARFPTKKGWSIRAAHNTELALRIESSLNAGIGRRYIDTIVCSDNPSLAICLFDKREDAIEVEKEFYTKLLPPKT